VPGAWAGGVFAHLPFIGLVRLEPVTTGVCIALAVRRHTYGYLPSRSSSPVTDRYQIILYCDRSTTVWTTCAESLRDCDL